MQSIILGKTQQCEREVAGHSVWSQEEKGNEGWRLTWLFPPSVSADTSVSGHGVVSPHLERVFYLHLSFFRTHLMDMPRSVSSSWVQVPSSWQWKPVTINSFLVCTTSNLPLLCLKVPWPIRNVRAFSSTVGVLTVLRATTLLKAQSFSLC